MPSVTGETITESDDQLLSRHLRGDEAALNLLFLRHRESAYRVAYRLLSHPEDALDAVQDGFVKVYKNIEKYRGDGSFEGWLRRIFVNTSIEHFRRKAKLSSIHEGQELNVEDKEWNAFDTMAEKDILKIIQQLSPGYKQVFNLYVIEGFSHKEIGGMLGISEGTSKSQLARAKVILKRIIETNLTTT